MDAPNICTNLNEGTFFILCDEGEQLELTPTEAIVFAKKCSYFRGAWTSGYKETETKTVNLSDNHIEAVQIVRLLLLEDKVDFVDLDTNKILSSRFAEIKQLTDMLALNVYFPDPVDTGKNLCDDGEKIKCIFAGHLNLSTCDTFSQINITSRSIDLMYTHERRDLFEYLQSKGFLFLAGKAGGAPTEIQLLQKEHNFSTASYHHYWIMGNMPMGPFFCLFRDMLLSKQNRYNLKDNSAILMITMPLRAGAAGQLQLSMPKANRMGSIRYKRKAGDKQIATWRGDPCCISEAQNVMAFSSSLVFCEDGSASQPECKLELIHPKDTHLAGLIDAMCELDKGVVKQFQWHSNLGEFEILTTHHGASFIVDKMNGVGVSFYPGTPHNVTVMTVQERLATMPPHHIVLG